MGTVLNINDLCLVYVTLLEIDFQPSNSIQNTAEKATLMRCEYIGRELHICDFREG